MKAWKEAVGDGGREGENRRTLSGMMRAKESTIETSTYTHISHAYNLIEHGQDE